MRKCINCMHAQDYGESFLFIRCERDGYNLTVRKDFCCKHYYSKTQNILNNIDYIYELGLTNEDLAANKAQW